MIKHCPKRTIVIYKYHRKFQECVKALKKEFFLKSAPMGSEPTDPNFTQIWMKNYMTKHFLLYTKYAQRSILLKKVHRVVQINAERIKIHILVCTKNMHHDMLLKIVLLRAETSSFQYSFILLSNKQLFPVFQL